MKLLSGVLLLGHLLWFSLNLAAQRGKTPGHGFVGSWRLRRAERIDGAAPVAIPYPEGLIIFDSAGHTVEIITQGGRKSYTIRPTAEEALESFNTFSGFWGSYKAEEKTKIITYHPEGAVNPSLMGRDLQRGFELDGDNLVITSRLGESNIEGTMRWTWQRVPNIDNLSAEYRKVLGFWEWVSDGVINPATKETLTEAHRAPTIIVYAPSGYIGVHFVPLNRKPLAGHMATADEAKADIAGYIGYTAVLTLHPGWVVHHQLQVLSQLGGNASLDRMYEIVGDELHLTFPPNTLQGQPRQTIVTMRRLSGEREMLGD